MSNFMTQRKMAAMTTLLGKEKMHAISIQISDPKIPLPFERQILGILSNLIYQLQIR